MEKAIKLADEWVSANIPNIVSYRRVVPAASAADPKPDSEYKTVTYQLFYRGLPVQNRNLNVTFDGNGKLRGFYGQPALSGEMLKKMESLRAAVPEKQAKEMYLKAASMELSYSSFGGYYVEPSGEYTERSWKLVYSPYDWERKMPMNRVLDAVTGQWTELYPNRWPSLPAEEPAEIGNHWAAVYLRTLLEHGVIQAGEDGLIHPDRSVKAGDFFRMLAIASDPYFGAYESYWPVQEQTKPFADVEPSSPYYEAVNRMIDRKWLTPDPKAELHPEAELTRDQLAFYLSKITGYWKLAEKLADLPAFARLSDAKSVPHPGAAALALKLGLLTPQGGAFRPNDKVSLAQLAVVFVRMAERQGEWDRPLAQ
nr:S-layer homology domain-containing protein [Cohnella sp. CFH 77786]